MSNGHRYLGQAGAADYIGVSVRTLQGMRSNGGGPAYTRLGLRSLVYSVEELDRWKASRTFTSRAHELVAKVAA